MISVGVRRELLLLLLQMMLEARLVQSGCYTAVFAPAAPTPLWQSAFVH